MLLIMNASALCQAQWKDAVGAQLSAHRIVFRMREQRSAAARSVLAVNLVWARMLLTTVSMPAKPDGHLQSVV